MSDSGRKTKTKPKAKSKDDSEAKKKREEEILKRRYSLSLTESTCRITSFSSQIQKLPS